jgi:hypothetical protein
MMSDRKRFDRPRMALYHRPGVSVSMAGEVARHSRVHEAQAWRTEGSHKRAMWEAVASCAECGEGDGGDLQSIDTELGCDSMRGLGGRTNGG